MGVSKKIKQEINHIQLKQNEMKASIDTNTGNISNHAKRIEIVEKKIDLVKKDDIVQSSKEAIMEELREQRARRNNIVTHQIPEPLPNLASGNAKNMPLIMSLICLNSLEHQSIKMHSSSSTDLEKRVLREAETSHFCLNDPGLKLYILQNARKLTNSTYSSISIIPDLTQEQRKEEDKL